MSGTREVLATSRRLENGSREAFERSRALLRREGFSVTRASPPSVERSRGPLALLAACGFRVVRVLVLVDSEVDAAETRDRIRDAYAQGETRVMVRWPLAWRAVSNLERWGLRGVAVSGW